MRQVARSGRLGAIVAVLLGTPREALACPICFGSSDSLLAAGLNNGVLVLLGVTVAVLASFGGFFLYLMRRARAVERSARLARPIEQRGNG